MAARSAVLLLNRDRGTMARRAVGGLLWIWCCVLLGAVAALLVVKGRWYLVVALLLLVPAFVLLHRYPMAATTIWLLVAPLVVLTENGATRRVFWLVHRGLPVAALAIVVLSSMAGLRNRRLPRLGWPEAMMGGYLAITLLSLFLTSNQPSASFWLVYDRIFVPMCLYLLVRLHEPDETELRRLLPVAAIILLSQSLFGVLQWAAPGTLPPEWLGKVGERTTGSLRSPDIFGATVLFCGLVLLHGGLVEARRAMSRFWSVVLFVLALVMVFISYSRGTWLAGLAVTAGLLLVYPRFVRRLTLTLALLAIVLLGSGAFTGQIQMATQRFRSEQSEESALSRLPVVYAAVRMFREKPLLGWGYENFDRFDREFQSRVANLVNPEKDHASHNLYLTLLAEQGAVGFVLFLGPAFAWLVRSRGMFRGHRSDFGGRDFVVTLWLVLAAIVVVSNFHRMQVAFGFGIWWLSLGLIASVVARRRAEAPPLWFDRSGIDEAPMGRRPSLRRRRARSGLQLVPITRMDEPRSSFEGAVPGRVRRAGLRGRADTVIVLLLVPALPALALVLALTTGTPRTQTRTEPSVPRAVDPSAPAAPSATTAPTVSPAPSDGPPERPTGAPAGTTTVPNVIGSTAFQAHRRLRDADLPLAGAIPVQGRPGMVVATSPSPDTVVPLGTRVTIFVGTGPARGGPAVAP